MTSASSSSSTRFDPVRLIENHQVGVWRYLRALGADPSLADDLTQDTFVAVLQRPFHDYNRAATAAYLRKVAHNLFITTMRRAKRETAIENIDLFDVGWTDWQQEDEGESRLLALQECFALLTERAQLALRMRFSDRSSRVEIAEALDITEHGAKNLMQRAKKKLKECVERKTK